MTSGRSVGSDEAKQLGILDLIIDTEQSNMIDVAEDFLLNNAGTTTPVLPAKSK